MAGTFEVNGDGTTTVQFAYTAATARIQATVEAAAHLLYNAGREPQRQVGTDEEGAPIMKVIPWEELSNMQKLGLVDALILERVQRMARGYLADVRQAAAAEQAAEDEATVL